MLSIQGGKRAVKGLAMLFVLGSLGACASQEEVQDAYDLAKQYETEKYNLAKENAQLQARVDQLTTQLREAEIAGLGSGTTAAGYHEKINRLQDKIDSLGRPLEDVETFNVEGGYVVMIQDKLLFESGKAELGSSGIAALQEIAAQIKATPRSRVFVRGHTDSDPVKKPETRQRFPLGNIELSAARALAVAGLLMKSEPSLEADITVMGFGQHDPLKKNDSAANKRLNRRVEIFVQN